MEHKDRPYYRVDFKIGDTDITFGLDNVTIINSISAIFQLFIINFRSNTLHIISEKIYGQEDIFLEISLTTENIEELEIANYRLVILSHNIPLPEEVSNRDYGPSDDHALEDEFTIYAIPKGSLKTMATTVNKLFQDDITPLESIKKIVEEFTPDVETEIYEENANNEKSEQIIIPPMPLIKSIRYLDNIFGIYNGPSFCYCRQDIEEGDVFGLWDLHSMMDRTAEYDVHILDRGSPIGFQVSETGVTPDKFYTFTVVNSKYHGNKNIIKKGYKHKYIVKPSDKLFDNINLDMDEIFSENSITDHPEDFFMNDVVRDRISIHGKNITGLGKSESFARTSMARSIGKLSEISFGLDRHLQFQKLTKVGIPIDIHPMVDDYASYQGKYIVGSSIIFLRRDDYAHYIASAIITAFRTNLNR
ncbi:MAG: hypothetical protein ACOCQD_01600 [archaeon]